MSAAAGGQSCGAGSGLPSEVIETEPRAVRRVCDVEEDDGFAWVAIVRGPRRDSQDWRCVRSRHEGVCVRMGRRLVGGNPSGGKTIGFDQVDEE